MIRGFYTSAAGMLAQLEHQDVIANNLANASTPGYKRSSVSLSTFAAELRAATPNASMALSSHARCLFPFATAVQDSRPGFVQDTGVTTHLAIEGPGCFVVSAPGGERLTRSGNFRLNDFGQLVTSEGYAVLGQGGPIQVSGADWSVDSDGNVSSSGEIIDKLRIESKSNSGAASPTSRVIHGSLEGSNVNAVQEMVNMIAALRAYEASQRTIQAIDQTLDKVINQMTRTG